MADERGGVRRAQRDRYMTMSMCVLPIGRHQILTQLGERDILQLRISLEGYPAREFENTFPLTPFAQASILIDARLDEADVLVFDSCGQTHHVRVRGLDWEPSPQPAERGAAAMPPERPAPPPPVPGEDRVSLLRDTIQSVTDMRGQASRLRGARRDTIRGLRLYVGGGVRRFLLQRAPGPVRQGDAEMAQITAEIEAAAKVLLDDVAAVTIEVEGVEDIIRPPAGGDGMPLLGRTEAEARADLAAFSAQNRELQQAARALAARLVEARRDVTRAQTPIGAIAALPQLVQDEVQRLARDAWAGVRAVHIHVV